MSSPPFFLDLREHKVFNPHNGDRSYPWLWGGMDRIWELIEDMDDTQRELRGMYIRRGWRYPPSGIVDP